VNEGSDQDSKIKTISLEFNGTTRQTERILYRFSSLLEPGQQVSLRALVETTTEFDEQMLENLKSEAALLAADTSHNETAAKLLDELL